MNIFIDSNILFKDYFFENKSNKKLLEYCKDGFINIYLADIVLLEIRRQFQKELESKEKEIEKLFKELKRLKIDHDFINFSIESHLNNFDDFYRKLSTVDNFTIIQYKNEFLPYIVDRAIYYKKPFSEGKSELKDALIWKTYSDFAEANITSDCILLTNNTSDFCEKNDNSKIHQELVNDSNKFLVVNSSYNFIKTYASVLESPSYKFTTYVNQIIIDEMFVYEILSSKFENDIKEMMHYKLDNMHPSDIVNPEYLLDGILLSYGCDLLECEDIEYEILNETALISGKVFATCEVQILEYNSVRDPGEDQYKIAGEVSVTFEIHFNFDLKVKENYSDFEITDMNILEVI